ncbi:MAG: calcium/sodium antiporter [Phycisphaerae bacterium]|nr:calcium/sodium antiporter [Phycisphaerae bacterium]
MNDYVLLILGVICAGIGGEIFIRGTVGIAQWARVSPAIIGVTVAAFATSSPELAVSFRSSLAGTPEISLGDVLGSNVENIALILALALCISGITVPRQSIKRDFPLALFVSIFIGILAADGMISRWDGLFLLTTFVIWLTFVIISGLQERQTAQPSAIKARIGRAVVLSLVGLAILIGAGFWIVTGAKGIAQALGMHEFVIGATIVAVGTSVPELATTILAKIRGYDEISLGTILGSNIFNALMIVATTSLICPIRVHFKEVAVALVFGFVTVACTFPFGSGFISRKRGMILLGIFVVYLFIILHRPPA